jgi:3-methylfumaryl-CoA hydratase
MTISTSEDFSNWVGRKQAACERIDPRAVAALAATLDWPAAPAEGAVLPAGWQWLLFNPAAPQRDLGEDGHPRRNVGDSFLPSVPLPRRMWAGSRIRYHAPLIVGAMVERTSVIQRVVPKEGRSGRMCFVTVSHTMRCSGRTCIVEEQDIVYREAAVPGAAPPTVLLPAQDAPVQWRHSLVPQPTLLFRYSALTFNGHRIHYDLPYARDVEGYRGLVVHGPLTATLLQQFAQQACRPGARLAGFEFKGVSPLFANEAMELQGWGDPADAQRSMLRVLNAQGGLAMQADATWDAA